jgi:protein-S-isoprenylcysteine O-methyltransferase Ste14
MNRRLHVAQTITGTRRSGIVEYVLLLFVIPVMMLRQMILGASMKKAFVMSLVVLIILFPLFFAIDRFALSNVIAYTLLGIAILLLIWIDYRLGKVFPKKD